MLRENYAEWEPAFQDHSPAEQLLLNAAAAVRDRRMKYGPPQQHFAITAALINAAFGTAFSPADWATMMQLDKIARSRGPGDHPDNDIDGAGYAACRAECRRGMATTENPRDGVGCGPCGRASN